LKNVGYSNESIRMQVNLMGDAPPSEMEWNETFFGDCFDNVTKVVTWISRKGIPFARHQTIAQDFIVEKKIDCDDDMLKSVETRFESKQPRVIRLEIHALV
jgi:hypothetical protein